MSALFSPGLVPVLAVVLAPGVALDLVPAIHAQGHAVDPTRVPAAVPGHAQTARALVGSLVPAANHHVKAKASHDQSQSEQVIVTVIVSGWFWNDSCVCVCVCVCTRAHVCVHMCATRLSD